MTAADAGRMLAELREEAGISRDLLADAAGYSPGWIRQLETGARTRASTLTVVVSTLARLTGLDEATTVADVLEATDGDHKPEGPTYRDRPEPSSERDEAARKRDEIRRGRADALAAVKAAKGPDELVEVADRLLGRSSPFEQAARRLTGETDGEGRP